MSAVSDSTSGSVRCQAAVPRVNYASCKQASKQAAGQTRQASIRHCKQKLPTDKTWAQTKCSIQGACCAPQHSSELRPLELTLLLAAQRDLPLCSPVYEQQSSRAIWWIVQAAPADSKRWYSLACGLTCMLHVACCRLWTATHCCSCVGRLPRAMHLTADMGLNTPVTTSMMTACLTWSTTCSR